MFHLMTPFLVQFLTALLLVSSAAPFAALSPAPRLPAPPPKPFQHDSHPPSDAELRARATKLTENQHSDDAALDEFERTEHQLHRTGGPNPRVIDDKTYRVVPSGFGVFKILTKADGKDTDAAEYHRQLLAWQDVLQLALRPSDSRAKTAAAKWEKKKHDRAELVDASRDAFVPHWLGQETRNGRLCDVLELTPDPNFHPHTLFQEAVTHVTAKIWVDHSTDQLVRGEAHIVRDISVGGGFLGKLYRGGFFFLEQDEIFPGLWLPTRYQYDFSGRKFLFTFEEHQYIEISHYRRIGTPQQALAVVQSDLSSGKPAGDP
jgi:hypothetical protein